MIKYDDITKKFIKIVAVNTFWDNTEGSVTTGKIDGPEVDLDLCTAADFSKNKQTRKIWKKMEKMKTYPICMRGTENM